MCNNILIYQNSIGKISFCKGCKNYQIQLGNILTSVEGDEFNGIKKVFDKPVPKNSPSESVNNRVLIKTPMSNLMFQFSFEELKEIQQLFAMSSFLIQAYSLLN